MKFGIFLSDADVLDGSIKASVEAAVSYEKSGFYSVSVNDHFYSPLGSPKSNQLECFTTLTAIAMATTRIKLVPAVASASFRSPALLAKIISAIDQASDRVRRPAARAWRPSPLSQCAIAVPQACSHPVTLIPACIPTILHERIWLETRFHFDLAELHTNES